MSILVHGGSTAPRWATSICQPCLRRLSRAASLHQDAVRPNSTEALASLVQANRDLPLPPMLNTKLADRKRSHVKPKAPAPDPENLTPFQKKLQQNVFAHILASPVRACHWSRLRGPKPFFLRYTIHRHPETGIPWVFPVVSEKDGKNPLKRGLRGGRSFMQRSLVQFMSKKRGQGVKLVAMGPAGSPAYKVRIDDVVWRQDMETLVHELLVQELKDPLRWVMNNPELAVCPEERGNRHLNPDSGDPQEGGAACVLFLRPVKRAEIEQLEKDVLDTAQALDTIAESVVYFSTYTRWRGKITKSPRWWQERDVREYVTTVNSETGRMTPRLADWVHQRSPPISLAVWDGNIIPAYSLVDLLGENILARLMNEAEAGDRWRNSTTLLLRPTEQTLALQKALFALAHYESKP